jgi:hypothetical protein
LVSICGGCCHTVSRISVSTEDGILEPVEFF